MKCPQFHFLTKALTGQEDCLILNVYVPEIAFSSKPDTKLPVMVWIHGGALTIGNFLRDSQNMYTLGVKIRNLKMDFKTGSTWHRVRQ